MSYTHLSRPRNASVTGDAVCRITITHLHHPHAGESCDLVYAGKSYLTLVGPDGRQFQILKNWTNYDQSQGDTVPQCDFLLSFEGLREMVALLNAVTVQDRTVTGKPSHEGTLG